MDEKPKTIEQLLGKKIICLTDVWYLDDEKNFKVTYDPMNEEFEIELKDENNGDEFTAKSFVIDKENMQNFLEQIIDFFKIINTEIK